MKCLAAPFLWLLQRDETDVSTEYTFPPLKVEECVDKTLLGARERKVGDHGWVGLDKTQTNEPICHLK